VQVVQAMFWSKGVERKGVGDATRWWGMCGDVLVSTVDGALSVRRRVGAKRDVTPTHCGVRETTKSCPTKKFTVPHQKDVKSISAPPHPQIAPKTPPQ
jgi:hypothetical protein